MPDPLPAKNVSILAIGEVLWDMFASGPRFGGAPANFANHAASLGALVNLVSRVGDDELGREAIERLRQTTIDTSLVTIDPDWPTGRVKVEVDADGHASYHFHGHEAWDRITFSDAVHDVAMRTGAVCFGTLAQRSSESRDAIISTVMATQPEALRILDLNLREPYYDVRVIEHSLELANVLKLNDDELRMLAKLFAPDFEDEIRQAKKLIDLFDLHAVAITRGERGGLLVRGEEVSEVAANETKVRDTVGAGDSFTAAVAVGLLKDLPLDQINRAACRIAEYVCTREGATPELPELLRKSLR